MVLLLVIRCWLLLPLCDSVIVLFCCALLYAHSSFDGKQRAGCFAYFGFLVSRDCCVALSHGAVVLSALYDCGIS